jgi:hypothetical protein
LGVLGEDGRARESNACPTLEEREVSAPDRGVSRGNVTRDAAGSRGSPLPDATAAYVAAAGQLAAAAVARGDRGVARRVLEDALRAVEVCPPRLMIAGGAGT